VVEPDGIDAPGYEMRYWSHRVKLLDLALANAFGPCPTLATLELHVAADTTPPVLDPQGFYIREALLWGIIQLRAARAQVPRPGAPVGSMIKVGATFRAGVVDDELTKHALVPTLPKRRKKGPRDKYKDPALANLVRALSRVRLGDEIVGSSDVDRDTGDRSNRERGRP